MSKQERNTRRGVVKKLKGGGQKVRRAQVLLKLDADGPAWNDIDLALRRSVDGGRGWTPIRFIAYEIARWEEDGQKRVTGTRIDAEEYPKQFNIADYLLVSIPIP
ncbi:MAG: glycoside hydrolase [Planctomycetes bacterium]|nr:glycoside hydrolase [Planctomycetota bacterium]